MCEASSPARRNLPTAPGPRPDPPHGGFRSAQPEGADAPAASPTPHLTGWPRDLAWDEFREISSRPAGESEDAQISVELRPGRLNFIQENGEYRLGDVAFNTMIKRNQSWAVGSARTDELLAHEQGHYDIAGLCYRDMVAEIRGLRNTQRNALVLDIRRVMGSHDQRADLLSQDYDSEEQTDHGRNRSRQQAWEQQISQCRQSGVPLTAPA
ncbi:MAG: DUF922 domain-containing protein [Candidatus Thiodiazotropha sp.]